VSLFRVSNSSTIGSDVELIGVGLLIGTILVVLVPMLKSCEYLGSSKTIIYCYSFFYGRFGSLYAFDCI